MLTPELAQQLPPGARALYDVLTTCGLPGQVRTEIDAAPVANVKNLLRALGHKLDGGLKTPALKDALVDEWMIRAMPEQGDDEPTGDDDAPTISDVDDLPEDEPTGGGIAGEIMSGERLANGNVVQFKTGEQLLAEQRAAKEAAKKEKAVKPIDPMAEARKARYAEAARIKAAATADAGVSDGEVIDWIEQVRQADPGAVCAKEMEVYRWVEGRKIGHQRWNELWRATDEVVILVEDDDSDLPTDDDGSDGLDAEGLAVETDEQVEVEDAD
jgi:hypothetical protein